MKKGLLIIGLFALMLILAGCKNQIDVSQLPSDQGTLDKVNGVPDLIVQPKTEPIIETPKEPLIPAAEEPIVAQNEFIVKKGDSFIFGKNKVTVKEIQSASYVILDVNGETIIFGETRVSEIIGDMLLTYADSNFNLDQTIILRAEDFALKANEYLLKYKEKAIVNGDTIKVENLVYDSGLDANVVWVSATSDNSVIKILQDQEVKIGKVKIKALKIRTEQPARQYAHLLITPN